MRVRRTLAQCVALNLWLGLILVITPLTTPPAKRVASSVILDLAYGIGFLLATLLCVVSFIFWSEAMERRIAVIWIQRLRIWARTLGFSMCLAFFGIELLAVVLSHGSLNAIEVLGLAGAVLTVQGAALSDGDLTPTRERHIWGSQIKEHKRWMPPWRRLS